VSIADERRVLPGAEASGAPPDDLQRLQREVAEHATLASLTADVGIALTQAHNLDEMLRRCAQAVVDRLGAAFARIWTLNEAAQVLELQTSAGLYTHIDGPHGRVPVGKFKIGSIAEERKPHLTNQVVGDPRVSAQEWARREGMIAFAGYPLLVGEQLVGVMAMFSRRALSDADLAALSTVANAVAVGVGRARAWEALNRRANELALRTDELSRLTVALERSNSELDQFAYVASHDLKAPLRGIGNLAQWIEEDLAATLQPSTRDHLSLLRSRVQRMEALIDGILSYSRAGRLGNGKPELVSVRRLVRDVIDLIAPPPGVSITVAPDLPEMVTDVLTLQQVFLNLISNAIKHGGAGVGVTIAAAPVAQGWEFSVGDDGPGIRPEFQDRVWGMFQTLAPRDKVEGTGIGLALVKKIVEARGGTVALESQEGAGATFRFVWPTSPAGDTV